MPDPAYDHQHQLERSRALEDAYGKPCPRCGEPMLKGQDLDFGHSSDKALDPKARADRIEHRYCNRSAGAKLGQQMTKYAPSRTW